MEKSRLYILIAISFLLGLAIGGVSIKYIYESGYENYDKNMLNDMERMSYNFHRAYAPDASGEAQSSYILYSYRAWKAGVISDTDFYLHQALGLLRLCISLERKEKVEIATKTCVLSEEKLKLWDQNMSFEDFRNIVDSEYFKIDMLSNNSLQSTAESGG